MTARAVEGVCDSLEVRQARDRSEVGWIGEPGATSGLSQRI